MSIVSQQSGFFLNLGVQVIESSTDIIFGIVQTLHQIIYRRIYIERWLSHFEPRFIRVNIARAATAIITRARPYLTFFKKRCTRKNGLLKNVIRQSSFSALRFKAFVSFTCQRFRATLRRWLTAVCKSVLPRWS